MLWIFSLNSKSPAEFSTFQTLLLAFRACHLAISRLTLTYDAGSHQAGDCRAAGREKSCARHLATRTGDGRVGPADPDRLFSRRPWDACFGKGEARHSPRQVHPMDKKRT